jgi:hypothetical protein
MAETSIRGLIAQRFPKEVGEAGAAKPMSERTPLSPEAAAPPSQPPGYASDIVASGAAGAGRGAADLVGLPGTIGDLLTSGGQWALRNGYQAATGQEAKPGTFFGGPTPEATAAMIGGGSNPIGGSNLKAGISKLTGGATDYQPYTMPGEYARTAGEFLPAAMAFGGLSPASLLGNAAIPAATSETAGQLTKGTPLEPYARLGGALVGGFAGNALTKPTAAQLPSAADIKASAGYADLKAPLKAAQIDQPTYQGIVDNLWNEANDFGLTTKLKGEISGTLNDFAKRADQGGASLYDLEILRRSLRNIGADKTDQAAQALSSKLIGSLDQSVDGLSSASIAAAGEAGTPTLDALKQARQTWQTGVKSDIVEQAMERAKNAASGYENGLRVEFRKLLNNKQYANTFNETERGVMQGVVRGTLKSNALRWLGGFGVPVDNGRNFLGSVMGGGAGASLGSAIGGPVGAAVGGVALPAIGTAAKLGANAATRNQATLAEALVKAGPQAGEMFSQALQASKGAGREALLRALLQSQSAVQVPISRAPVR